MSDFSVLSPRAKVALVQCKSYEETEVMAAVERGFALLGGADQFAQPNENLLLKPNILVGAAPEEHVTTHPMVFKAVAAHLKNTWAKLSYGDSPGFGRSAAAATRSGLAAIAEELEITLADFTIPAQVSFPEGKLIKQFTFAKSVLESDGLISLAKMKTHALTRLTGAVKNQFGCIPGALKAEWHSRMPDMERFSQMLVDLNRFLKPRLYVMDGIIAMEGNGPRNGDPRPVGVLLISSDPIALDATAARLINLNPALVPTLPWGEAWGLGKMNDIEILGDPVEDFIVKDFVANRQTGSTTSGKGWYRDFFKNWIIPRPIIIADKCTRCGTCVKICPVTPKAVDFRNGDQTQPPVHHYDICIRCYCCQEMCPFDAIEVQTPLLGRLIRR
jgi:uncharacterized protein (DUF362 family)/ferredoxin